MKIRITNPDVKAMIKALRDARKSFGKDPEKSRAWLVRMGILDKTGKKLARRYR